MGDDLPEIKPKKKEQKLVNKKNKLEELSENMFSMNLGPEEKFVKEPKISIPFTEHPQGFFSLSQTSIVERPKFQPFLSFLS